jgi:hypothetical protein
MGFQRNWDIAGKHISHPVKSVLKVGGREGQILTENEKRPASVPDFVRNDGDDKIGSVSNKDMPVPVQNRSPERGKGDDAENVSLGQLHILFMLIDLDFEKTEKKNKEPCCNQNEESKKPLPGCRCKPEERTSSGDESSV